MISFPTMWILEKRDDLVSRHQRLAEVGMQYRSLLRMIRSGTTPNPDELRKVVKPFEDGFKPGINKGAKMGACSLALASED